MKNRIQWNVFVSGMSENAIFVIFELGIKYRTIFIKTNYLKWLNIEISVRFTKLKAIWIILIFEKNYKQTQVHKSGGIFNKNPTRVQIPMQRLSVQISFEFLFCNCASSIQPKKANCKYLDVYRISSV